MFDMYYIQRDFITRYIHTDYTFKRAKFSGPSITTAVFEGVVLAHYVAEWRVCMCWVYHVCA